MNNRHSSCSYTLVQQFDPGSVSQKILSEKSIFLSRSLAWLLVLSCLCALSLSPLPLQLFV